MRCFRNTNIGCVMILIGAGLAFSLILPIKFIIFLLTMLLICVGFIILTRC